MNPLVVNLLLFFSTFNTQSELIKYIPFDLWNRPFFLKNKQINKQQQQVLSLWWDFCWLFKRSQMRSPRADCKLIPRACSQSPLKIALDCSVLAEPEVSTVLIKMPEPLLVGQCAVSQ